MSWKLKIWTAWVCGAGVSWAAAAEKVDFNRDIRPILSDKCFHCHGPDEAERQAELRLDTREGAFAPREGHKLLVPGNVEQSHLYARLIAADAAERMPPPEANRKLTNLEIETVKRWIEQGAKWDEHWAFVAPTRPELPIVKQKSWVRNPIDAFVLEKLEQHGLTPAAEANRETLLRRVTLDLTGLPPTPAETAAFLADSSPAAYEKVVDRLLASPRYGERMAMRWLDAGRYADTNGYQTDAERFMWRWRDWVIEAYNRNLPFDQFTIEQLAGDLLPEPTLDQRIATGFHRNHRGNAEGGIIPEEFAAEYVVDRVETTATVWLGLTLGCSRCHDHKYDPFSQRDFYQLFAFFNNVPERGKAWKYGNSPPFIVSPTKTQQQELAALQQQRQVAETAFQMLLPDRIKMQSAWEEKQLKKFTKKEPSPTWTEWNWDENLLVHFKLDGSAQDAKQEKQQATVQGKPQFVDGPLGQAFELHGQNYVDAGDVAKFNFYGKFTLSAWVYAEKTSAGTIISRMTDEPQADGYSLSLHQGKLQVNLVKRWLDDCLRVESRDPFPVRQWVHVAATYDGSRVGAGVKVYINGQQQPLRVVLDELNQSFDTDEPLRIGAGNGPQGRFVGKLDDVRVYDACLQANQVGMISVAESPLELLKIPAAQRTPAQAEKLTTFFLLHDAPTNQQTAYKQLQDLRKKEATFLESLPTTMVMEEMPQPRDTFILLRGQYDKLGERVQANVPSRLPPMKEEWPKNRLGLARWLVAAENPLTARVTVNRFWQMYFGEGLVKTVDDFGSQGEPPTHAELLDWLATEFIRLNWDMKAMQRLIVTSSTYRQASIITPELLRLDPENRLLARGPRFRLTGIILRDQALFASGMLTEQIGGPSVRPYQPDGIWKDVAGEDYLRDSGPALYRRSLYTFWKRTAAPPNMLNFDASTREFCTVRQARTNTPLQALTLLNEITFVEAARALAQRVMQAETSPQARLTLAFQWATGRTPKPAELQVLQAGFSSHLSYYKSAPDAALKLLTTGEWPRDATLNPAELAAYTLVANMLLNLDETVTKE